MRSNCVFNIAKFTLDCRFRSHFRKSLDGYTLQLNPPIFGPLLSRCGASRVRNKIKQVILFFFQVVVFYILLVSGFLNPHRPVLRKVSCGLFICCGLKELSHFRLGCLHRVDMIWLVYRDLEPLCFSSSSPNSLRNRIMTVASWNLRKIFFIKKLFWQISVYEKVKSLSLSRSCYCKM